MWRESLLAIPYCQQVWQRMAETVFSFRLFSGNGFPFPASSAENGGNGFQFPSVQRKQFSVSCEFGPSLTVRVIAVKSVSRTLQARKNVKNVLENQPNSSFPVLTRTMNCLRKKRIPHVTGLLREGVFQI